MRTKVEYYQLIDDKKMGDGNIIKKNMELILIKKDDDGMLFFETDDEFKSIFWTNESEVYFIKEVEEDWSEEKINERNKYIIGDFI